MCSAPKGRTSVRRITCSTLMDGMEYAEYAAMICRSNAGIARREEERAHLRKSREALSNLQHKPRRIKTKGVVWRKNSFLSELRRAIYSLFM